MPEFMTVWRPKDIALKMGIKTCQWRQMRREGKFGPKPLKMSSKSALYYSASEVQEWFAAGCPNFEDWNK